MQSVSERTEVPCAVCGPGAGYRVRFPERLEPGPLDFAARKRPARQHFRIVECDGCRLVYANPIVSPGLISRLYCESRFIKEAQLDNMARDYQREVRTLLPLLDRRERLLEIGCANGFFLKAARQLGFKDVVGVEPGREAVRNADPQVRTSIVNAPFSGALFPAGSFDLVCCFHVLDHLPEPNALLRGVFRILRPGGVVVFLHHNIRSWLPRLLGKRSPMYDVEHIYLFDRRTAGQLLRNNGFTPVTVRNVWNTYTVGYALKMFPLTRPLQASLAALARLVGASRLGLRLPAGNMISVGRKP